MIDNIRFFEARTKVLSKDGARGGIGTLGEKLLHRILKLYFEPCEEYHEIKYLGSVADIKNGYGITEIQTRSLEKLLPKLKRFLERERVTVVYPLISEKRLFWFDKQTGEVSEPRRSPKHGKPSDALPELSKLSELIPNENLTVKIVLLSADEYKSLDGWDKTGKLGATCIERIPREITDIITLQRREDFSRLIPESLGTEFTAKDFGKAAALRGRRAYFSLKFLLFLGILERGMGCGRAYIYKRI